MTWELKRTDTFLKNLKEQRNNHQLLQELEDKLKRLKEDPHAIGGELGGKFHGKKSTRITKKFRLIFQIDSENRIVYLVAIDHRGSVYD
jgi:addiction module RelE/StbE family toxin